MEERMEKIKENNLVQFKRDNKIKIQKTIHKAGPHNTVLWLLAAYCCAGSGNVSFLDLSVF